MWTGRGAWLNPDLHARRGGAAGVVNTEEMTMVAVWNPTETGKRMRLGWGNENRVTDEERSGYMGRISGRWMNGRQGEEEGMNLQNRKVLPPHYLSLLSLAGSRVPSLNLRRAHLWSFSALLLAHFYAFHRFKIWKRQVIIILHCIHFLIWKIIISLWLTDYTMIKKYILIRS